MGETKINLLRLLNPILVLKHYRYLKIYENIYEKNGIYVNIDDSYNYEIYEYIKGNKKIIANPFGNRNLNHSLFKIDRNLKINYLLDD